MGTAKYEERPAVQQIRHHGTARTRFVSGNVSAPAYKVYAQRGRERGWDPSPAYIGLGLSLRGTATCHHMFGTLTSPRTFGNYGAGTTLFWIDPERDLTFVCLSAGVMEINANIERFQRLSDIVISAADRARGQTHEQRAFTCPAADRRPRPKLLELTEQVLFGDVWERPGLSKRDRSLATVSALIALNRPEPGSSAIPASASVRRGSMR